MAGADVFISYRRDQRETVLIIADKLRELGLTVWFDASLEAGSSFDEEINREVRAAKVVLVCWSPEAVQSRWVRAEASIGLERDVLVAAMLRPAQLMPPYNLVHAANLEGWSGAQDSPDWGQVLSRIGKLVGRPELPDIARAKALESGWLQADQSARAEFAQLADEARRRFAEAQTARPAQFDQKLADMGGAFEGWLALRRLGKAGERPNPLMLVDETGELQKELAALKAEHSATVTALKRAQEQTAASAGAANGGPQMSSAARWGGLAAAFVGGILTVMVFTSLFTQQETAATEEPAAAAEEAPPADYYADPAAAPADAAAPAGDYAAPAADAAPPVTP